MNYMDRERNEEIPPQQKPPETQPAAVYHHQTPPPHQKCPRCDSSKTKFCYYNNYSLSQPRYFCKACRRYWTHGGILRNVPIGGGCRRTKRQKISSSAEIIATTRSFSATTPPPSVTVGQPRPPPPRVLPVGSSFYAGGGFMSSLAAVQSLSGQGAAAAANMGGQFGASMALLQGISFPPSKPPAAAHHQFQPQNYCFTSQQSFIPARPFNSWTQSLINASAAVVAAGDGSDRVAGSRLNPNQWSENCTGFNHQSQ